MLETLSTKTVLEEDPLVEAFLEEDGFFKQMDSLIVSGPTLTNVNDFRAILVEDPNQPSRFEG